MVVLGEELYQKQIKRRIRPTTAVNAKITKSSMFTKLQQLKFNHLLYQQDRHQNLAAEMNIVNTVNLRF